MFLFAVPALAMDLVCDVADPAMGVTEAQVTMDGAAQGWVPYQEKTYDDGITRCFLMNLDHLGNGAHTVTAVWKNSWGEESAPSVPLDFLKPASPTAPVGIGLKPTP